MSFDVAFLDVLAAALKKVHLEAIVVGNAASVLFGAPVMTQDADIVVRDTPLNRRKLHRLAEELGGVIASINEITSALRIHLPDIYVDVLFDKIGGGITFNSLRSRSARIRVGKHTLVVASLEDVIRSKEAAGRKKDLAVLPILRDTLAVRRALGKKS